MSGTASQLMRESILFPDTQFEEFCNAYKLTQGIIEDSKQCWVISLDSIAQECRAGRKGEKYIYIHIHVFA